jgi:phosphotransferase system enzyme I (PtsI)
VAHLYDPCHPAVLRLVADTIAECRRQGKGVSVCGEMAGDTAFSELLLAMGLRSFSMHPSQIVAVKERILATDAGRWCASLPRILAADDPERECVAAAGLIAQERGSAPRGEPARSAVVSATAL